MIKQIKNLSFKCLRRLFFISFVFINLCALQVHANFDLSRIEVALEETKNFPGDWSLAPEEAYLALKHCRYGEKMKILEFGAGESTAQFVKLLVRKNIPFEYHVFENDIAYIKNIDQVTYHYYELPNIPFHRCNEWKDVVAKYQLPNLPVFDLVIVDGPHGIARAEWYEKFKKYTKAGTIILIDDFHHFKEFAEALDKNFIYETIVEYNQCENWKIINEGIDPIPVSNPKINKTFKIVKIK